jgi:hypothetical protein
MGLAGLQGAYPPPPGTPPWPRRDYRPCRRWGTEELRRYRETGPGLVARTCAKLQRKHFALPIETEKKS